MAQREITIYAMLGSQYVAKVLAALEARKIPHFCEFVSVDPKTRKLPSGGKLVPEMEVRNLDDPTSEPEIVCDSEVILHWLDDNMDAKIFPNELASEVSVRASGGVLPGAVLYYNWVDPEGYKRSMNKTLARNLLPSYIPFFRSSIIDLATSSERKKFRGKSASAMGLDDDALNDEPRVRQLLIDELKYFQSLLKEEGQLYLIPGDVPTAADFSVYGQVERLVGDVGDADVFPSKPTLKDVSELKRFWEWHTNMRENVPLKFSGKTRPKV